MNEIVLNFFDWVYVSKCIYDFVIAYIIKDHTNMYCSFNVLFFFLNYVRVRGEQDEVSSFSFFMSVFTPISNRPEQTLRAMDDPLFPPACHLLLIYTA